jgi:hypothetical protein
MVQDLLTLEMEDGWNADGPFDDGMRLVVDDDVVVGWAMEAGSCCYVGMKRRRGIIAATRF